MCLKGRVPPRSCLEGMNPTDSIFLNHIFIGEEIHPLVTLWKRNILTVITPTEEFILCVRVTQFAVWLWVWMEKQPWQITPLTELMQLLCNYKSVCKALMWEQNTSENKWDLLWSCSSCSVTSSLVAANGQGCPAHLGYFSVQASHWTS